jgi:hypothetical protein
MATNFPTSLDALTNPQGTDSVAAVPHAAQHANANDAIEALQAKVGINGSTNAASLDKRVATLENASVDTESIQDIVAGVLTAGSHTNITVTYDDIANKINLAATYSDEQVMDAIATSLTAGTGITKTYDDIANTITVAVDTSSIATQSYVTTAISNLVNSAPGALDTLNEIAAALGNDSSFATTITNALALKAPLASPALTGTPTAPTATAGTNTTQIATTAFSNTASSSAVTTANSYTDSAITSLSNSIAHPTTGYVPVGDLAQSDGVATLGPDGFVPASQLNLDEKIQDVAALMFTSATHSNITVAYDDNTGRLALTGIPLTQEQVQDFIAPLFAHAFHTNVTSTYDDTNNRIILEGSGGGGSGTGGSLTNSWFLGA